MYMESFVCMICKTCSDASGFCVQNIVSGGGNLLPFNLNTTFLATDDIKSILRTSKKSVSSPDGIQYEDTGKLLNADMEIYQIQ